MRIIWMSLLSSIALYYAITFFVARSGAVAADPTLSLVLIAVAVLTTLASFAIKNKLLTRAVEQRHLGLVQQAYIATWAVTEVAALLGLQDYFAMPYRRGPEDKVKVNM